MVMNKSCKFEKATYNIFFGPSGKGGIWPHSVI